jgi:hypothetical protein
VVLHSLNVCRFDHSRERLFSTIDYFMLILIVAVLETPPEVAVTVTPDCIF